jgi:hypothetical protein
MLKKISKFLGLSFMLVGVVSGIILVKRHQDMNKGAEGCIPNGQCMTTSTPCCNQSHADTSCGYSIPIRCGPVPTGGNGNNEETCSGASASRCQGKKPGDICNSEGVKCSKTGATGGDGKPKCSCAVSSNSGSGNQGSDTTSGNNPDKIGPFTNSGFLTLYFKKFIDSIAPKYALKKNTDECDLTNNDIIIDTASADTNGKILTELFIDIGDFLCIYGEDIGTDAGPYPMEGFTDPDTSNKCGVDKVDISPLVASAQADSQTIESRQCWGDYPGNSPEKDFDDYGLILSTAPQVEGGYKIELKIRFQGITTQKQYSNINIALKQSSTLIWSVENTSMSSDNQGVFDILMPTYLDLGPGTYDILIKGDSHLQKRFTISYGGQPQIFDFSTSTNDELIAGDINADNAITIKDVSIILKYYTDFSVAANSSNQEMLSADINKDGFITIEDVALIALNWSDFTIPGDE